MLDFLLVLGLVPGTNFQLSFSEIALFAILLNLLFAWRLRLFTRRYHQAHELAALKRRAKRRLIWNGIMPEQSTDRRVVTPQERTSRHLLYARGWQAHQYARSNQPERSYFRPRSAFAA